MKDVVVLKIGGAVGTSHLHTLAAAAQAAIARNLAVVVVHGGGPRINDALNEAGLPVAFVGGRRVTSAAAMPLVQRVLAEELCPEIVSGLAAAGVKAVAVSGADGLLLARVYPDLGRTAEVASARVEQLVSAIASDQVPVVAPIGVDVAGGLCNINADTAAAAIAGALAAKRVVFLSDVPGIYEDFTAKRLMRCVSDRALVQMQGAGRFSGGMRPKVDAILSALASGAEEALVVHGQDVAAVLWSIVTESVTEDTAAPALGTYVWKTQVNVSHRPGFDGH